MEWVNDPRTRSRRWLDVLFPLCVRALRWPRSIPQVHAFSLRRLVGKHRHAPIGERAARSVTEFSVARRAKGSSDRGESTSRRNSRPSAAGFRDRTNDYSLPKEVQPIVIAGLP